MVPLYAGIISTGIIDGGFVDQGGLVHNTNP